jgi:hypothetical protein
MSQFSNTTHQEYNNFPSVWKPQEEGDQSLFLVKIPASLRELTWRDYKQLLTLRIQWIIHCWLEQSGEDQVQTHRKLAQALTVLSLQESPNLYADSETQEPEPLWWWTQEWAETFLNRNETLIVKFHHLNGDREFPRSIDPTIQQDWMTEHNEFTLENWLSDLTYGLDR